MKYFVARVVASISSTQLYEQVLSEPFKTPFFFYLQFLVLVAAMLSVRYWVATIPFIEQQTAAIKTEAINNFPSDFSASWNGEQLIPSASLEVDFPTKTPVTIKELADKLAVIQLNEDSTNQSVLIAVTPTKLRLLDQGTVVQEENIALFLGETDFILNKETLPMFAGIVESWITSNSVIIGYVYPIGILLFLVISRTYLLLIESGIIYLFLRISNSNLPFRKLFQLVMSLFVPAEIINQVANIAGLHTSTSILSLSFWIFFVYVFFSINKKPATA